MINPLPEDRPRWLVAEDSRNMLHIFLLAFYREEKLEKEGVLRNAETTVVGAAR